MSAGLLGSASSSTFLVEDLGEDGTASIITLFLYSFLELDSGRGVGFTFSEAGSGTSGEVMFDSVALAFVPFEAAKGASASVALVALAAVEFFVALRGVEIFDVEFTASSVTLALVPFIALLNSFLEVLLAIGSSVALEAAAGKVLLRDGSAVAFAAVAFAEPSVTFGLLALIDLFADTDSSS